MKKICRLCKKQIKTKIERYVHVVDWDKEVIVGDIWCHLTCFNKSMNKDLSEEALQLQKQAREMLERLKPVMDNLLPKPKEVFEIV